MKFPVCSWTPTPPSMVGSLPPMSCQLPPDAKVVSVLFKPGYGSDGALQAEGGVGVESPPPSAASKRSAVSLESG